MDLPPLSAGKEDIEILAKAFLKESNRNVGKEVHRFSAPVMAAFLTHDWPGNIRELQNIIEYSDNMENSDTISLRTLYRKLKVQ